MNIVEDDDPKGVYNKAPVFKGEHTKVYMYVHLLSVDTNLWCVITKGPFIPEGNDDIVKHPKKIGMMLKPKRLHMILKRGTYLFLF